MAKDNFKLIWEGELPNKTKKTPQKYVWFCIVTICYAFSINYCIFNSKVVINLDDGLNSEFRFILKSI